MAIIDVHAHHVPASCLPLAHNPPGRNTGETVNELTDLSDRIADMDKQGVEVQALSAWMGFYSRDLATARAFNDAMAESVSKNPNRLFALAIAPLAEPEQAPRELERAIKELGMRGVAIGTNVNGKNLDTPEFGPFFAKVEELDVPMFIHPVNPLAPDRLAGHHLSNLIGNVTETAVAAASLVFGGVLQEFPRLKPYLAHGGGTCPYIRGRWDQGWRARDTHSSIAEAPSEYLRRLYYDALTHSHQALEFLVKWVGADHVMLGSDYPFNMGDLDPVRQVKACAALSPDEQGEILQGTATELFRL